MDEIVRQLENEIGGSEGWCNRVVVEYQQKVSKSVWDNWTQSEKITWHVRRGDPTIFECIEIRPIVEHDELHGVVSESIMDMECFKEAFEDQKKVVVHWIGSIQEFRARMRKEIRRELIIQKVIRAIGGNHEIFTEFADTDPDSYGRRHVSRTSVRNVMCELLDSRWYRDRPRELAKIKNVKELGEFYGGEFDYDPLIFFGTAEERKRRDAEKRRKELEGLASQIAHEYNVGINTLEFLSVVEKQIANIGYEQEQWNNPEIRMEQAAACYHALGSARGQEVYFDDLNFENGRYNSYRDDLEGILEWIGENCPLLWAQHEERKLAQQAEVSNDTGFNR